MRKLLADSVIKLNEDMAAVLFHKPDDMSMRLGVPLISQPIKTLTVFVLVVDA